MNRISILLFSLCAGTAWAQTPTPSATPKVERKVEVNIWNEITEHDTPSQLISIEVENKRTGEKKVTSYLYAVELETPLRSQDLDSRPEFLPRFEVNFTPYIVQMGKKLDEDLHNAVVMGQTEVKRNDDVFSVTVYAIGARITREIKFGSPKLKGAISLGLNTLGYRYIDRPGLPSFTGLQLLGVYPGFELNYQTHQAISLSLKVEETTKYAIALNHQSPVFENKPEVFFGLHPNSKKKLLKHLDQAWYGWQAKINTPGTFPDERVHKIGVTVDLH